MSIFGANLVPTGLHFPSQNPPKSFQNSIPRVIIFVDRFLDGFLTDLGSILGPNLGPCWHHFRPKWCGTKVFPSLFCFVRFFLGFFRAGPWGTPSDRAPEPMGYPSCARFSDPFGFGFQRFCGPFCKFCGSFSGFHLGAVHLLVFRPSLLAEGLVGFREA